MLNLILAVVVGGAGVAVLVYLLRIVVTAAGVPTFSAWQTYAYRRCLKRAAEADRLLEERQGEAALSALHQAFCFTVVSDLKMAATIGNHHSGLLARILGLVAETQGGGVRLLSLAKVDRLLNERRELQRTYIAARQSPGRQQRSRELLDRLEANQRELEPALRQLVGEAVAATRAPLTH